MMDIEGRRLKALPRERTKKKKMTFSDGLPLSMESQCGPGRRRRIEAYCDPWFSISRLGRNVGCEVGIWLAAEDAGLLYY